jgi:hypothetical protein
MDGLVGLFGPPIMPMGLDAIIKDRLIMTAQIPNPGGPAEFASSIDEQRAALAKAAKVLGIATK